MGAWGVGSLRVYIGHDQREQEAYEVAAKTAQRCDYEVIPLYEERLRASGMLTRPLDRRGGMWDLHSNAAQATDFAVARFFVPLLAHSGICLFVDCDVVFYQDSFELLEMVQDMEIDGQGKAVYVVKHPVLLNLSGRKMDGQVQTNYPRKLWSSVILWNCDHPAHRRLNLTTLNQLPGRDLHRFSWLHDDEIGELDPKWNWLVGIVPKPAQVAIAHLTLGGPWLPDWKPQEHDDLWLAETRRHG